VRTVDDGEVWVSFLNQGIKHAIWGSYGIILRWTRAYTLEEPTGKSNVGTTFSGPPETVLENSGVGGGIGHGDQPQAWVRGTLWMSSFFVVLKAAGLGFETHLGMGVRHTAW